MQGDKGLSFDLWEHDKKSNQLIISSQFPAFPKLHLMHFHFSPKPPQTAKVLEKGTLILNWQPSYPLKIENFYFGRFLVNSLGILTFQSKLNSGNAKGAGFGHLLIFRSLDFSCIKSYNRTMLFCIKVIISEQNSIKYSVTVLRTYSIQQNL